MRAFIAVEIPENVRRKVTDLVNSVRSNQPIKWVEFQNLHITLKFLGEVPDEKVKKVVELLGSVTKDIKPFIMSLHGLGCFPNPRSARVLWIGMREGGPEMI